MNLERPQKSRLVQVLMRWIDTGASGDPADDPSADRIDWTQMVPFLAIHLLCLGALLVGVSAIALIVALALYLLRMFVITGFYHRYFSHRTFKTSRPFQFLMAVAGCSAGQRGPMWWAAHHRHHHKHSDEDDDLHSPRHHGFWFSHSGWFMTRKNFFTRCHLVRDWQQYPELRWLDRFDWIPMAALAAGTFLLGHGLSRWAPQLGTSGLQMLIWGFFISTVVLYHATYTINSLAHRWGHRRFETNDDSRNNFFLAALTLGEGWHNNHHHYPAAVRQGFYWWEIDPTYYGLLLLKWTGLIWDLRSVPPHALQRNLLSAN